MISHQNSQASHRGAISVLAALFIIGLLAMVAFCVDIGYVLTAKEELQRTADATALATCWDYAKQLSEGNNPAVATMYARTTASSYAAHNNVTNMPLGLAQNASNDPAGDLVFGYIADLNGGAASFETDNSSFYNAVKVRVRKDPSLNGEVPYFFARIFGLQGQMLHADATAAIVRNVNGFEVPADGSNLEILPFALDYETWDNWMNGGGSDDYAYNPDTRNVTPGSDGKKEVNLYPQGTGSPGNRGTVDIGGENNSTSDISRQIVDGVSPGDMQSLSDSGRSLEFNSSGEMSLNGDTGISAGVKNELTSITGKPRIIPVFKKVVGPGNNAEYTIVKWQGVRIVDVQLTGPMSKKHVTIQPAPIVSKGVIPAPGNGNSSFVFSNVVLVK
ncbi:MAG: TadG family pilus assembly protein [Pirellulales bacterium]